MDPIICKKCHSSFLTHSSFLKTCLNVTAQKKLHEDDETLIDTHTIVQYIKTEEIDIKLEEEYENQGEPYNTNCPNVKSEEIKHESDITTQDEITACITEDQRPIESKATSLIQHTDVSNTTSKTRRSHIFEFKVPQLKRGAAATTQTFNCDECSYETTSTNHPTRHQLKHKCAAEEYVEKCSKCEHDSKQDKEDRMFTCEKCHHETKLTDTHADSAVQTFKCDECQHQTGCRKEFISHLLRHKDLREEPTYKCGKCHFETKFKQRLTLHEFKHKETVAADVLQCDKCGFKSVHRQRLALHQLTHRDACEQTYNCNICTFETKIKKSLKRHQLRHKDRSELQMYKCDVCDFQTKRKYGLKTHQMRHRDPSEVPKFKCGECDYESNHKVNLARHALRHRKPSDLVTFKCD